jgi:PadR family transcriptional regulator PadR
MRINVARGSLYPALRVLEQEGHIEGGWEIQSSGPARKVYHITASGQAELTARTQTWKQYADMVGRILGEPMQKQLEEYLNQFALR